jgi:hypothetical protein
MDPGPIKVQQVAALADAHPQALRVHELCGWDVAHHFEIGYGHAKILVSADSFEVRVVKNKQTF